MKKVILFIALILMVWLCVRNCTGTATPINGYESTVTGVSGNVLTLASGLKARLLGVDGSRDDVEMFLRTQIVGQPVTLYADSHNNTQKINSMDDTVDIYAVATINGSPYCVNRLVVNEYPDSFHEIEIPDSVGNQWRSPDAPLIAKTNLALYMKQRTFLIITREGIGTGFFINEDGLAVTNWHVLAPSDVGTAEAVLYEADANDNDVYTHKTRRFKNILWCSNTFGLDITIMSVDLENNEKVPFFNLAKQHPNQGDFIATYGNPHGQTASYTTGVVSAFRHDEMRDVDLIQYDMPTNGGNSGGPVCDKYGQIVAVHELGDKSAQNINYGIDALQLRTVLNSLGLKYGGK